MKQIVRNTLMLLSLMSIMQVVAAPVDLAGADMNVEDAAGFAELADGVTNSSGGEPVTLTFDISSDMEYAGKISGNIKLVKKGVGMLTLSGDNDYTGGTVIGGYDGSTYTVGGRLRANSLTAFGAASGAITVNSNCQQSNMASNKVTCVVFNAAGTFAYPINTSTWTTPANGPSGEAGKRQYNVAVPGSGAKTTLSGKITGGGLSVHFGSLEWTSNAPRPPEGSSLEISGDIDCHAGTCYIGGRAETITVSGKITTLGIYQTDSANWPVKLKLSGTGNSIGVFDVGGGSTQSAGYVVTASSAGAFGGATVYSRTSNLSKSSPIKIGADQTVESLSMNPAGVYAGGSLAASDKQHYIQATAVATVTMNATADRTNDWLLKDDGAAEAMSLVWNPIGDYTYTCVGHTNTINGTITVRRGTFEVGDSCSFPNVTAISVANGATLKVSSAEVPFGSTVTIEAESDATLDLAGDMTAETVKVGDHYLSAKDFSAGNYNGLTITGAGKLYVTTKPGDEETYTWIGGGADSNITTAGNWQNSVAPDFDDETPFIVFAGGTSAVLNRDIAVSGITFDGVTAFDLSASGNYVLSLGEGGISNAPTASARAVTVSAPVMPKVGQVWQMETNTAFTLSGILKKYGTSTPTITVRQGSYADPTITFIGAATAEDAGDFAGDIVFEETDLPDSDSFGKVHVRASGYEPFGPGGTLKLRGAGRNRSDSNRIATLFLSNAVISKAVEFGEYYAACYCAEDNTTNVINGAFAPFKLGASSGAFPPKFMVGTNAVLRLCGDIDFGTRNNSDTADVTLSSSASSKLDRPQVPTGKIVFDGRITRMPRRMKRVNPIGLEFNAADNAITNLYLRAADATYDNAPSVVKFGTSYALSNGQAKVTFPKSGEDLRAVDFDLNGTVQHILGFASGMSAATRISSSAGHGTLRVSQSSDVVFEGYVATNVTLQMEGAATLTFSHSKAFKAGSTLVVSNGTVAVSNASALNEDVTLKLLGGKISIPEGQTALVGEAYYLDGNGELKPLKKGTYGPNNSTVGSFFAPGSGSVRVKKGEGYGFVFSIY